MDANSLEAIKERVEALSVKYSWSTECCHEVAQVIYDAKKACLSISWEEWREFLKKEICK